MLYKILVLIVSIVSMLASSLLPAGLVTSPLPPSDPPAGDLVTLHRLATLSDQGKAAAVSLLWLEIDGKRIHEDLLGHGYLKEVRLQVGLKASAARSLAIGENVLPLQPTDVITVREFTGAFRVDGAERDALTLILDGEVQATFVNSANVERIRTEGRTALPQGSANLAYVVLDVGKVNTVDLARGGDPVRTGTARNGSAPIPVGWLKVDDRVLTEYTWSEGFVDRMEFLARPGPDRLVMGAATRVVETETRVLLERFVGTYVLFNNEKGELMLKLDGYAGASQVLPGPKTEAAGLAPRPTAYFEYDPVNPSTSDTVVFMDRSTAVGNATILLREWNFGDGSISTATNPRHRFKEPDRAYTVSLVVTDSNLERSQPYSVVITPANSRPVAEFDFYPKLATDLDAIQFHDRSWDVDGAVVSWFWDFGYIGAGAVAATSAARNPIHTFPDDGVYTVTLTVTDDRGSSNTIRKVVPVANVPPNAAFSFSPTDITLTTTIQFTDLSSDPDGGITNRTWTFGDGSPPRTAAQVNHIYPALGDYRVVLRVTDDDGAESIAETVVTVRNLAPIASYTITTPAGNRTTGNEICFADASWDDEGQITSRTWRFGTASYTGANVCHAFGRAGTATVNLTVRDRHGAAGYTQGTFMVENGAPLADFTWSPLTPRTGETIRFTSTSVDPDGKEDLVDILWTFHDGTFIKGESVTRAYADSGLHRVNLTITDSAGHVATKSVLLPVANRPPKAFAQALTGNPVAGENFTLESRSSDPDGHLTELIWNYDDGYTLRGPVGTGNISTPVHAFRTPGVHRITHTAIDDDGEASAPYTVVIHVLPPPPVAAFTWSPDIPVSMRPVQFTDQSYGVGSNVNVWNWKFGDQSTSTQRNPVKSYGSWGTYTVTLEVQDDQRPPKKGIVTREILINGAPQADFSHTLPLLHQPVQFTDESTDPDGQVVNWTWSFGDGKVSYLRHPTHRWDTPGTYVVALVARDDRNATAEATSLVRIVNTAPLVSFAVNPIVPVANATTTFTSTSTDPEGNLTGFAWTIQTDTVPPLPLATGTGATFTYTFPLTGIYQVKLRASDGDGGTGEVTTRIRVASDATKTLTFPLTFPDDSPMSLSNGPLKVTASLRNGITGVVAPAASATVTSPSVGLGQLTLPAGLWAAGDAGLLDLKSRATGLNANPRDPVVGGAQRNPTWVFGAGASQPVLGVVKPVLKVNLTVTILPPTSTDTLLGLGGSYQNYTVVDGPGTGCPCYSFSNQSERVRTVLVATWEGTTQPARTDIVVTTMYLGYRYLSLVSDPTPGLLSARATVQHPAPAAGIEYRVPFLTPLDEADPLLPGWPVSMYLPGWHRVTITALENTRNYPHPATAANPLSATSYFFEDPGGLAQTRLPNRVPFF